VTHRWICACVLTLALGGATPAFANTRIAVFSWTAATGPVAGYAVYATTKGAANQLVATVTGTRVVVGVEANERITLRIAAYDSSGNLGPLSDASAPLRLCPGDFDGDEVVGTQDWLDARNCIGKWGIGICAGADLDLDAIVSVSDFKALKVGAEACPPSQTCPGDFDDDGQIGASDVLRAQQCFGQPAQGDCIAGDMDGNGVISSYDINYQSGLWGQAACAY